MILPSFLLSCTRAFPGRQIQLLYALAPLWDAFRLAASWTCCSISLFVCLFILEAGWGERGNMFLVAQGTDCNACPSKHYRSWFHKNSVLWRVTAKWNCSITLCQPVHPSFYTEGWINLCGKEKEGGGGEVLNKWIFFQYLLAVLFVHMRVDSPFSTPKQVEILNIHRRNKFS